MIDNPHLRPFALRPARVEDDAFLRCVYRSTREPELRAMQWNEAQTAAFCDMQFLAQSAGYRQTYPGAEYLVICTAVDEPVGRLTKARSEDALVLVDLALLPAFRGYGIGTWALRLLQEEAATLQVPLFLSVDKLNPALSLYQRLGFSIIAEQDMRYKLRWAATAAGD